MNDEMTNDPTQDPVVAKIRALMAKAESSPFPAEAATFMAKAQAMIERHAIDEARLHGAPVGSIGIDRLTLPGSYSRERAMLWAVVAQANRCRVVTTSRYGSSAVDELCVIGRPRDREVVKVLAASLEIQALRQMAALAIDRRFGSPVVQRRSFLRGFASEVSSRLEEAKREQPVFGAAAAALELASQAVDHYVDEEFDLVTRRSQARHDGVSFSQGRAAGATADVGGSRLGGQRRRLGTG